MKNKKFFGAVAVFLGNIIGAGILGIPFVVSESGVVASFFCFAFLAAAMLLIYLLYGEILLRTEGQYRLPGLAGKYLGFKAKLFFGGFAFLGGAGGLLVYIILIGNFLSALLSGFVSISPFQFSLIFSIAVSYFVFKGMKTISLAEIFTNSIFLIIIFSVFIFAAPDIDINNFVLFGDASPLFPYGVILFSFLALPAIPEVVSLLKTPEEKRGLKKIMVTTFLLTCLVYLLFAFVVVGVSGSATSEDALQGLLPFLGSGIVLLGMVALTVTLVDSFLVISFYLRNVLNYDFKVSKGTSSFFVCAFPVILFLAGFREFINVIDIVGAVIGAVEGVAIILIFRKAKKVYDRKPEYSLNIPALILYPLMFILISGAVIKLFL